MQFAGRQAVAATLGRKVYRGRKPSYSIESLAEIDIMIEAGSSYSQIAKRTGVCRRSIGRVVVDRPRALRALARWS